VLNVLNDMTFLRRTCRHIQSGEIILCQTLTCPQISFHKEEGEIHAQQHSSTVQFSLCLVLIGTLVSLPF